MDSLRQARRHAGAPLPWAPHGHAGERLCSGASGTALSSGLPAGPGHQRHLSGGEIRLQCGVFAGQGGKDLPRTGVRHIAGIRHHLRPHRQSRRLGDPALCPAGRQVRRDPLPSPAAGRDVHPCGTDAGNRTHSPDPGPYGIAGLSAGGRYPVRRKHRPLLPPHAPLLPCRLSRSGERRAHHGGVPVSGVRGVFCSTRNASSSDTAPSPSTLAAFASTSAGGWLPAATLE